MNAKLYNILCVVICDVQCYFQDENDLSDISITFQSHFDRVRKNNRKNTK